VGKIVVGIDGSDAAKDALRWALDEARLRSDEVVAVHAWEAPPVMPEPGPAPGFDLVAILPEVEEAGERLVKTVVEEVVGDDSSVTVESVAIAGPPASVLVDAARDADMLVVGSRGHGGFTALLLGSVSQQLAHHAPCPLVIHRTRDSG
jgi:nucleotide-binding universal stress UspA family protein